MDIVKLFWSIYPQIKKRDSAKENSIFGVSPSDPLNF